jgi:hypothetical protein
MAHNVLFVINGLGLGNSTRCHAVIDYLVRAGSQVHILTSGNGLAYFEGRPGIASLEGMSSFFYSQSKTGISGWTTARSAPRLLAIVREKRASLERWLAQRKPDVAVVDSEYVLSPLRRRKIPIVAINNSEVVVSEYLRHRRLARGVSSHFWFVEFADYLFHRHFVSRVMSPFPIATPTRASVFERVGLIVRGEVEAVAGRNASKPFPAPRDVRTVVCMLSGSVHASSIDFGDGEFPFDVDVVGVSGPSRGRVTFHGRSMNNIGLLERADVLVINGGYSAVSEALAFGKPTFVVPVPGHAEQFVNSMLAVDLGLGFAATEQDVMPRLCEMHTRNEWIGLKPRRTDLQFHGASEAAAAILRFLEEPARLALA